MLFEVSHCDSGVAHAGHRNDLMDLLDQVESRMLKLIEPGCDPSDLSSTAEAAAYHLASGGQRVRARLALSSAKALGLSDADAVCLASCVELLHNSSLIHDDLQDQEEYRRGVKTVCAFYGNHIAICTGDLLLSASYAALSHFSDPGLLPGLISLVHQRTSIVISGQCDVLNPSGTASRDMSLYERIAAKKSGSLLSLPIELALAGSGHQKSIPAARHAAEHFAIGYQIMDDMHDVEDDEGSHAVNALLVLQASTQDDLSDAREVARAYGRRHLDEAILGSADLPGGSGALLQELAQKLRDRL